MLFANLHSTFERIFGRTKSVSIFYRVWFAIVVVVLILGVFSLYRLQKTIRPSAKRVVEDTLVDSARLLANLVKDDIAHGRAPILDSSTFDNSLLHDTLPINHNAPAHNQPSSTATWYDHKAHSQFHVYITDAKGIVLYDSLGKSVGRDFSRWNDVFLTLQGKYGARSTHIGGDSVMYVASPIIKDGAIIGVASVGKPVRALAPYLHASEHELLTIVASAAMLALLVATLVAIWLRHSIAQVARYTKSLASANRPHFYMAQELNALSDDIKTMKDTLENRAYVNEFVHTLTHELKSPLSAICASAEILTDPIDDDARLFFAKMIGEQGMRMTSLIERLLALAKIEQPNFELNLQTQDIFTLCQKTIPQYQALQKSLSIHLEGAPLFLPVDEFWLLQAIHNLLDNAIRHAHSFVLILVQKNAITVAQDCPKLPDYVLKRAFEPYFSAHDGHTKGTGLGLNLVASVMQKHSGTATICQMNAHDFCTQYPKASIHARSTKMHIVVAQLNFDCQAQNFT